jgi:hypothetical protein
MALPVFLHLIPAYDVTQAICCMIKSAKFYFGSVIALSLGVGAIFLAGMIAIAPLAHAQTRPVPPSPVSSPVIAQSPTPITYVTEVSQDKVVMQITESEFKFRGYLERTSGNMFVGQDEQVRVMYDRDTSRVVVINVQTGDEYYNYFFSTADEGAL